MKTKCVRWACCCGLALLLTVSRLASAETLEA